MLVVVLLPLHGIANGVSSIRSPAHFHRTVPAPGIGPSAAEAPGDHDTSIKSNSQHQQVTQTSHQHALAENNDHHAHATEGGDHHVTPHRTNHHEHGVQTSPKRALAEHEDHHADATPERDHHRNQRHEHASEAGDSHAVIGKHSHDFEQVNVVYLDGDPGGSDLAGGKHAPANADAALPAWSMPGLAKLGPQALPQPACGFLSCGDEPLLRPPSLIGLSPT